MNIPPSHQAPGKNNGSVRSTSSPTGTPAKEKAPKHGIGLEELKLLYTDENTPSFPNILMNSTPSKRVTRRSSMESPLPTPEKKSNGAPKVTVEKKSNGEQKNGSAKTPLPDMLSQLIAKISTRVKPSSEEISSTSDKTSHESSEQTSEKVSDDDEDCSDSSEQDDEDDDISEDEGDDDDEAEEDDDTTSKSNAEVEVRSEPGDLAQTVEGQATAEGDLSKNGPNKPISVDTVANVRSDMDRGTSDLEIVSGRTSPQSSVEILEPSEAGSHEVVEIDDDNSTPQSMDEQGDTQTGGSETPLEAPEEKVRQLLKSRKRVEILEMSETGSLELVGIDDSESTREPQSLDEQENTQNRSIDSPLEAPEDKVRQLLKSRRRTLSSEMLKVEAGKNNPYSKSYHGQHAEAETDFEVFAAFEKNIDPEKKISAFQSNELDSYLEENKDVELPFHSEAMEGNDIDADIDEIDGITFVSFGTSEGLNAYVSVEGDGTNMTISSKVNSSPRKRGFLGGLTSLKQKQFQFGIAGNVSKYLKKREGVRSGLKKVSGYLQKGEESSSEMGSPTKRPTIPGSPSKSPSKTNDITKIKGWRNKFLQDEASGASEGSIQPTCIETVKDQIRIMRFHDLVNLGLYTSSQPGFANRLMSNSLSTGGQLHRGKGAKDQYDMIRKDTITRIESDEVIQPPKGKIYGRRYDGKFATKLAINAVKKRGRPFGSFKKSRGDSQAGNADGNSRPLHQLKKSNVKRAASKVQNKAPLKKKMVFKPVMLSKRQALNALNALVPISYPFRPDFMMSHIAEKGQCEKPGCHAECVCDRGNTPTLSQYIKDYTPPLEDTSEDMYPDLPTMVGPLPECGQVHCRLGCVCSSLGSSESKEIVEKEHCGRPDCVLGCDCQKQLRSITRSLRSQLWTSHGDPGSRSQSPIPMLPRSQGQGLLRPKPVRPGASRPHPHGSEVKAEPTYSSTDDQMMDVSSKTSAPRKSSRIKDRPNFAELDKFNSAIYYDTGLWMDENRPQHATRKKQAHRTTPSSMYDQDAPHHDKARIRDGIYIRRDQGDTPPPTKRAKKAAHHRPKPVSQEKPVKPQEEEKKKWRPKKSIDPELRRQLQVECDIDVGSDGESEAACTSSARTRIYVPSRLKYKADISECKLDRSLVPSISEVHSSMPIISSVCSLKNVGVKIKEEPQDSVVKKEPEDDSVKITKAELPAKTAEVPKKKLSTQMVLLQKKSKGKTRELQPILLEIKSNCNWSGVRAKLLSKISSILSKHSTKPFYLEDYCIQLSEQQSTEPVKIPSHMVTETMTCTEMVPVRFTVMKEEGPPQVVDLCADEQALDSSLKDSALLQTYKSVSSKSSASNVPSIKEEPISPPPPMAAPTRTDDQASGGVSSFNHFKISTNNTLVKSGIGSFIPTCSQQAASFGKLLPSKYKHDIEPKEENQQDTAESKSTRDPGPSVSRTSPSLVLTEQLPKPRERPKTNTSIAASKSTPKEKNVTEFPRLVVRKGNFIYEVPDAIQQRSSFQDIADKENVVAQMKTLMNKMSEDDDVIIVGQSQKPAAPSGLPSAKAPASRNRSPLRVSLGKDGIWRLDHKARMGTGQSSLPSFPGPVADDLSILDTSSMTLPLKDISPTKKPSSENISIPGEISNSDMPVLIPQETKESADRDEIRQSLDSPPMLEPVKNLSEQNELPLEQTPNLPGPLQCSETSQIEKPDSVHSFSPPAPEGIDTEPVLPDEISADDSQIKESLSMLENLESSSPSKDAPFELSASVAASELRSTVSEPSVVAKDTLAPKSITVPSVTSSGQLQDDEVIVSKVSSSPGPTVSKTQTPSSSGLAKPARRLQPPKNPSPPPPGTSQVGKSPISTIQLPLLTLKDANKPGQKQVLAIVPGNVVHPGHSVGALQSPVGTPTKSGTKPMFLIPVTALKSLTRPTGPMTSKAPTFLVPNTGNKAPIIPQLRLPKFVGKIQEAPNQTIILADKPEIATGRSLLTGHIMSKSDQIASSLMPTGQKLVTQVPTTDTIAPSALKRKICDTSDTLVPPKQARRQSVQSNDVMIIPESQPDVPKQKTAAVEAATVHYKIAGSQVVEKNRKPEVITVPSTPPDQSEPLCPVHGSTNVYTGQNAQSEKNTVTIPQLGIIKNGKFRPFTREEIKTLDLSKLERQMQSMGTPGQTQDTVPKQEITSGAVIETPLNKPQSQEVKASHKEGGTLMKLLKSPAINIQLPSRGEGKDKPGMTRENTSTEMSSGPMDEAGPSQSAEPTQAPKPVEDEVVELSDSDSETALKDDVDILGLEDECDLSDAARLRSELTEFSPGTKIKMHQSAPKKKIRKQLLSDRTSTIAEDLEFEEPQPVESHAPNRPSTPELLESSGTDRIMYKCNRERRRRHDMTYKFQLLQSLLYPSSEKMSKLFLLNAAAKTVGSLKKQHERLLNELEEAKAYRESVVAKLKALRESTKHKYTAITVNEETGTRTVIRDPNMVNYMDKITSSFKPVSSPEPSHSPIVCRGSDIIPTPQQVATKPAKPKPTGPQSASDLLFKKLKAASSVSTVVSPSLACTSSTVTAKPRPATASTLLGAMAKDAALSLKAMSSPATSPNSKIGLTVVRSKPKSVTLDQVEKKELVLSKCENCGERVAFSSHVQVNISCPRCHHSILQLQESEPNKEPSERLVRATSITSQGSAVDVKPEAAIEISDSSSSSSEASDGSKVTAGDIKDILKDGVEGYVDNVGEDEVIVVIKDDKKSTPTKSPRDAGRAPSLQDEESVSVDSDYNSDSTGEGRRAGARKKLGFS